MSNSGIVTASLSGPPLTTAVDSTVSFMHLRPTQFPENLDRANPRIPKSRISCTPAGERIGMRASTSANSDWCRVVELSPVWSSPSAMRTPPNREVPAMLACRSASPERSTPGPFPYHRPKTPSWRPSPRSSACCAPHRAVAAKSSFIAGEKRTFAAFSSGSARPICMSSAPSGDPRYPVT